MRGNKYSPSVARGVNSELELSFSFLICSKDLIPRSSELFAKFSSTIKKTKMAILQV